MFFFKLKEKKVDEVLEMRVKLLEEKMRILMAENEALKKTAILNSCFKDADCVECQQSTINSPK
jgi:predicted metal-binding protein